MRQSECAQRNGSVTENWQMAFRVKPNNKMHSILGGGGGSGEAAVAAAEAAAALAAEAVAVAVALAPTAVAAAVAEMAARK